MGIVHLGEPGGRSGWLKPAPLTQLEGDEVGEPGGHRTLEDALANRSEQSDAARTLAAS